MIWFHSVFKSERKYKAEIVIHHERQNLHSSSFSASFSFITFLQINLPYFNIIIECSFRCIILQSFKIIEFCICPCWRGKLEREEDSNSITLYLFSHDKNQLLSIWKREEQVNIIIVLISSIGKTLNRTTFSSLVPVN